MNVNPEIFRAYDLRGIAGRDLTDEIVEHIGKAYGTYLSRRGQTKAIVGRDSRATSPAYSAALIRGLRWAGIDVIDIALEMVGTFYWAQYFLEINAGVYVSASHNPPQFNGFKFTDDYSETLVEEGMKELLRLVQEEDYDQGSRQGSVEQRSVRDPYLTDLARRLPLHRGLRVLVDGSNTVAGEVVPALLRKAGCEVIEQNTKVDSSFPLGTADPTEMHVAERVSAGVRAAKANLGVTYDADGDRIGIIDENGGIIWNDVLLALFAIDVLRDHPGATIMYNLLCSKTVPETIAAHGGKPFMWRVGHSILKKKNQEVKAAFIGELSGHFFFSADFYNHDDGAYATLRLVRYLAESKKTLSAAVQGLPLYISSPEIKIFAPDDRKAAVIAEAAVSVRRDFPEAEVIDDERAGDGMRLELADAMFVVRYSQNGPYLTIKIEAETEERYEELRAYLYNLLKRFPEIDWTSSVSVNTEALSTARSKS